MFKKVSTGIETGGFQPRTNRPRPFIQTFQGHDFYFDAPEECHIDIRDIAAALSKICRFNGHCQYFYSVAQHSVAVSNLVPPEDALAALLHDSAEAYVGDMTSPLKQLLPEYKVIEKRVATAVFNHFGIPYPLPDSIKQADLQMLATERRDLMLDQDVAWSILDGVTPILRKTYALNSFMAETIFLRRYHQIMGTMK